MQSDPSPEEFLQLACKRVGERLREARISIAVGGIAVPFTDLSSRGRSDLLEGAVSHILLELEGWGLPQARAHVQAGSARRLGLGQPSAPLISSTP